MSSLPKYSFEIMVAQVVALITCVVLVILDEHRLYAYLALPLLISFVIQHYRLRRAHQRWEQDIVMQIRQVIVERQYQELALHEPQHDIGDDLKDLREEIERHTLAKAE